MKREKQFQVLHQGYQREPDDVLSVPFAWIELHEKQAYFNHRQTLAELDARGGLGPLELYAVKHDLTWREARAIHTEDSARDWLKFLKTSGALEPLP